MTYRLLGSLLSGGSLLRGSLLRGSLLGSLLRGGGHAALLGEDGTALSRRLCHHSLDFGEFRLLGSLLWGGGLLGTLLWGGGLLLGSLLGSLFRRFLGLW